MSTYKRWTVWDLAKMNDQYLDAVAAHDWKAAYRAAAIRRVMIRQLIRRGKI